MRSEEPSDPSLPEGPSEPPGWLTGTAIDEFTPIYVALATPTKRRPQILSPADVDALDLTVVAALLGVGTWDEDSWDQESAQLMRDRIAADKRGETLTID